MKRLLLAALTLVAATLGTPLPASATEACTIILDAGNDQAIYENGDHCDRRYSPASTFKLALALIGFDSGLLTSPQTPAEPYKESYQAVFPIWRQTTDPSTWLKYSVIWYSQTLTQRLGIEKLQEYVDRFDYGNRDLSGDSGLNNGLTQAWLSSSLKITPREQAAFVTRLVNRQLPVSPQAFDKVAETVPLFDAADGWIVHGKNGTSWQLNPDGSRSKHQNGWFVGWAVRDDQTYVFVRLNTEDNPQKGFAGSRTKTALLKALDTLIAQSRQP